MIIEDLHARAPEHPAGFHYLIHAYDNPLLAEKAVGIARAYDSIAPDVPHALHMPTHIFVRLGLWADVVSWNERSAAAALAYTAGGATSLHYAHAMDYLVYGNLQIGEDGKALAALRTMNEVESYQDSFASFRRIKKELYKMGFSVAARPLPVGTPISGSPQGTKSAAQ